MKCSKPRAGKAPGVLAGTCRKPPAWHQPRNPPREHIGRLQGVPSTVQVELPWLCPGLAASPRDSISASRAGITQRRCQAQQHHFSKRCSLYINTAANKSIRAINLYKTPFAMGSQERHFCCFHVLCLQGSCEPIPPPQSQFNSPHWHQPKRCRALSPRGVKCFSLPAASPSQPSSPPSPHLWLAMEPREVSQEVRAGGVTCPGSGALTSSSLQLGGNDLLERAWKQPRLEKCHISASSPA